jgi:two-component system OmpR family sensor kinase
MTGISRWSLRTSLLAGVVGLTTAALLLVGAAGAVMLRAYLMAQLDEQLSAAATVVRQSTGLLPGTTEKPTDDTLRAYVSVTEFIIEVRKGDGATVRLASATRLPTTPLLDTADVSRSAPHTVAVPSGGRYRVVIVRSADATVLVGMSLTPVTNAVRRLIATAVVTSATVLVLLFFSARLLVKRRLRPLDEIAAAATALADGELDRRVPEPEPSDGSACTEMGRLSVAINGMLARIQAALGARAQSEQRMREFVADASHELRTPLTSIQGYLQLIRTGVVDLRERPDVLRRLEDESARMGALVTDLLYLARLDTEPALRREPVDLAALVGDAVADARAVEPDRPITVTAPGPAPVSGDADALRQVLANLLGNVRAHTPEGTAARIVLTTSPGRVRVTVADDGPGMSAEVATRAFERFWRADTSRPPTGGAGLGLAIAREAVQAHGGEVGIESAPGRGTTVWFELPRAGS